MFIIFIITKHVICTGYGLSDSDNQIKQLRELHGIKYIKK